jgi:MoxR-like ATPase
MQIGSGSVAEKPQSVLSAAEIADLQQLVRRMPVADHVYAYAERLVRVTRPKSPDALDFCQKWLTWGAGPRAGLNLILAAKARAMLNGQPYVACEDVAAIAPPILRHRLILNFAAQSESVRADDIIGKILEAVPKDEPMEMTNDK